MRSRSVRKQKPIITIHHSQNNGHENKFQIFNYHSSSSPSALSHPLHPLPHFPHRITQINKLQGPTLTNLPHPTPGKNLACPFTPKKIEAKQQKKKPWTKDLWHPASRYGIEACKKDRGKAEKKSGKKSSKRNKTKRVWACPDKKNSDVRASASPGWWKRCGGGEEEGRNIHAWC